MSLPAHRPIQELKANLRREMRARLRATTAAERAERSRTVCEHLPKTAFWQTAQAILFYAPLPDELDLWPALRLALAAGKQVALPWYERETDTYTARLISDAEAEVVKGRFGIREPLAGCQRIPLNQLDLALVPGLGFSPAGIRLGRGKGYYDRLLGGFPGIKCGVGYAWQMDLAVPGEDHDLRVNCIITPSQWRKLA